MNNFIKKILYKIISILDILSSFNSNEVILDNISLPNNIYVYTDTGYKKITNFIYKKPFNIWEIELESGYKLECADRHILFRDDYSEVFVDELNINDKVLTDKGPQKVIKINHLKTKVSMGDISVNDENHRFYSNGILSHNSTTTAIYCLWVILFNSDKSGLILSKSGPAGADLVKKIKDMYLYLPYHLKIGTMKWNQTEISFDNNSSISTESFSPTAGLGKTINFLILDEFAWCSPSDVEQFYNNIIPTVTTITNSNVCIMSTQNGFNLFYKIWKAAIERKNVYAPFKVDWWQVPQFNPKTKQWEKRTEAWRQEMIGVLGGVEEFNYQYGTEFSSSDLCLVSRDCIRYYRETSVLWENRTEDFTSAGFDNLFLNYSQYLFVRPDFNLEELRTEYFLLIIDLAEGSEKDHTIFNVFKITTDKYIHVMRWDSNCVDIEHAALEFWLLAGQLFNNEKCVWSLEWNTYGALFYKILSSLNEDDYDDESKYRFNLVQDGLELYNFINYKKTSMDEQVLNSGKFKNSSFIPGLKFTSGNKSTACSLSKMLFEKHKIDTTDLITLNELENFEDKNGNGSYKAAYGHDDSIMTFMQLPFIEQSSKFKDLLFEIETQKIENNINNKWNENNISYYSDLTERGYNFIPTETRYF